jgi:DNA-directed RNA polymerase subunit M/transcription elongation factor TFIIS
MILFCISIKIKSPMELYRENGIKALECVLTNQKNIAVFERNIYETSNENENDYNRVLLQIIGDVSKGDLTLNVILRNIKEGRIGWNHHSFDEAIAYIEEQDDFIEHPFQVEEGVLECKCGSKKVFSFSKQTRSADEPMTTYAECVSCNSKWTYSG